MAIMNLICRAIRVGSLPLLVSAAFTLAFPAQAALAHRPPTAKSFEGVWKITKVVRTGANAVTDTRPQPSLLIFYRGYYSIVRDAAGGPRAASPAPKNPATLTDQEKLARYSEWEPFRASAGTYEVKGNRLITHNVIAKQAKGMTATEEATFKLDGGTFMVGPTDGTEMIYTRVR
jgi:hypothetical protein